MTGSSRGGFVTLSCVVDPFVSLVEATEPSQNNILSTNICKIIWYPVHRCLGFCPLVSRR